MPNININDETCINISESILDNIINEPHKKKIRKFTDNEE